MSQRSFFYGPDHFCKYAYVSNRGGHWNVTLTGNPVKGVKTKPPVVIHEIPMAIAPTADMAANEAVQRDSVLKTWRSGALLLVEVKTKFP